MSGSRRSGPPRRPVPKRPPSPGAGRTPTQPRQPQPRQARQPVRARRSGRWVWWAVLAGLLVAGVVAVALTSGGGATSGKLEVAKSVAVDGSALPRFTSPNGDAAVGTRAPVLTGQTFNRSPIMVGGTGAPHVVVFVAHWCPHCQAEVPRIVSLQRAGRTDGVAVTAVATGTNANAPNYPPSAWLHGVGWPYPTLVDTASGTAAAAYGLTSYPYLVFVDASGNVAARVSGEVAPADLAAMFAALAAGKPVPVSVGGSASSG